MMASEHSSLKSNGSQFIQSHLTICKACSHSCPFISSASSLDPQQKSSSRRGKRNTLCLYPPLYHRGSFCSQGNRSHLCLKQQPGLLLLELKGNWNHSGAFPAEDATLEGRCFRLIWVSRFLWKAKQLHP